MKLLLDTQLLLWLGVAEELPSTHFISKEALLLVEDTDNELYFSAVSVWEVAIKYSRGKADFRVNPHVFRRSLVDLGYLELSVTSEHTAQTADLPFHHKDPFDRLLVAQAIVEGITLLTVDEVLAKYAGPVRRV